MNGNERSKKERLSTTQRKKVFLEALERSLGIQTPACKACGNLSRTTIMMWREKDPDFARAMDEINSVAGDFVESQLMQKVKKGDTTAIIFYCKTKLKHRGYTERTEVTGADGRDIFAGKTDEDLNNAIEDLKRRLE